MNFSPPSLPCSAATPRYTAFMPNVKPPSSQSEDKITVIHNEKWLRLTRNHAILTWMRENGTMGTLEITKSGTLRGDNGEEAMDLAAEQWARDLMLNSPEPPQLELKK